MNILGARWKSESSGGQRQIARPLRVIPSLPGKPHPGLKRAGSARVPAPFGIPPRRERSTRSSKRLRERPRTLVLPMTEYTTLPWSAHRDFLISAGARLVLPDHGNLLRAFNMSEAIGLAASLGVAVPKTVVVTSAEQALEAAHGMRFPVVLKPVASEELWPDGNLRTSGRPRYARDSAGCAEAFLDIRSRSSAVLLQEFVEGEGTGYFALIDHGELCAEFAHRRIRDVYPTGSGSAVRVSIAVDPGFAAARLRFCQPCSGME
jgi:predicted ATP-grasp superfamily ATP-dependent carboligase